MEKSVGMGHPAHGSADTGVELRELLRGAIRTALELLLEEEIKGRVGGRVDRRDGTYLRRLMISMGIWS